MANNREAVAKGITKAFIDAISGTEQKQWVLDNPEDRIFVGKLSPQSADDGFSSSVLIKQISVDYRIPKATIEHAEIEVFPQGNFFFRILPTLEQQRSFYLKSFIETFESENSYESFTNLVEALNAGQLSEGMINHKVQLLPVYEKIALDRNHFSLRIKISDIYNPQYDCGSIPEDSAFYVKLNEEVETLCTEVKNTPMVMPCQFRDKVKINDLVSEEAWNKYIKKQIQREEFEMYPRFSYSLSIELRGSKNDLGITVALSNETQFGDETGGFGQIAAKSDKYRINTLFNSGLHIKSYNTSFVPIELDYFADDYKYDRQIHALGNNCNVEYDVSKVEIQTTHVPCFIQHRLKTRDTLAIKFDDLIEKPVQTLTKVHSAMLLELQAWKNKYQEQKPHLTALGQKQFQDEITAFEMEIRRFYTGVELIQSRNMICDAFKYMNLAFKRSAKGYSSWRLFQIVFIVSLILDIVAHEPDLMLDEDLVSKAKTDAVDILYFPTGGGKTEAFLGILIFNLFFDRLRGKEQGVTALLKYPLRLLSVQQVQRVANILAKAEVIRQERGLEGQTFSLGYFVGEGNTPNKIDNDLKKVLTELSPTEIDEKFKLLDVCPYCGKESVHVIYDADRNTLVHICKNSSCTSNGRIPIYMVDDDVYRFLPSVIISTVDKMTAIGLNSRFHNLLCGADYKCPKHGYTARDKCLVPGCQCDPFDYSPVDMKDPAPTLLIQDELHLIKESLGAYNAHYETLIEYFIHNLSGCNRGIKVIGATATISAYKKQAQHLYWKEAIRFPAASPDLKGNFYSRIDDTDISRIIIGYAPYGKAIVNSVAYALQYLKKVVWDFYIHPEKILLLEGINIPGTYEEQLVEAKQLLEEYWIILEYNNVKLESNRVLQALEDPINTELNALGIEQLVAKKMTGDDTFQEVRATLSTIEHAKSVITDIDFNMIAATSMISHGVDADRFNLMLFYGMPGNTAEYIQAYSRVGRKHTGVVIDIMRPSREKDQSYLKNFNKFHEYKDILVDAVSINRWATKAVECTLPGIVSSLFLNHYQYKFKHLGKNGDITKYSNLKKLLQDGIITADEIKSHVYGVYKCSNQDSSTGKLYRQAVDKMVDELVDKLKHGSYDANLYLTEVFNRCYFHVMTSLRDTDKQLIVEMK